MSPYLFSADLAHTDLGRHARASTTVAEAAVLSISDLFTAFAEARKAGDKERMALIRRAVKSDADLAAEFAGFDYQAAA